MILNKRLSGTYLYKVYDNYYLVTRVLVGPKEKLFIMSWFINENSYTKKLKDNADFYISKDKFVKEDFDKLHKTWEHIETSECYHKYADEYIGREFRVQTTLGDKQAPNFRWDKINLIS